MQSKSRDARIIGILEESLSPIGRCRAKYGTNKKQFSADPFLPSTADFSRVGLN